MLGPLRAHLPDTSSIHRNSALIAALSEAACILLCGDSDAANAAWPASGGAVARVSQHGSDHASPMAYQSSHTGPRRYGDEANANAALRGPGEGTATTYAAIDALSLGAEAKDPEPAPVQQDGVDALVLGIAALHWSVQAQELSHETIVAAAAAFRVPDRSQVTAPPISLSIAECNTIELVLNGYTAHEQALEAEFPLLDAIRRLNWIDEKGPQCPPAAWAKLFNESSGTLALVEALRITTVRACNLLKECGGPSASSPVAGPALNEPRCPCPSSLDSLDAIVPRLDAVDLNLDETIPVTGVSPATAPPPKRVRASEDGAGGNGPTFLGTVAEGGGARGADDPSAVRISPRRYEQDDHSAVAPLPEAHPALASIGVPVFAAAVVPTSQFVHQSARRHLQGSYRRQQTLRPSSQPHMLSVFPSLPSRPLRVPRWPARRLLQRQYDFDTKASNINWVFDAGLLAMAREYRIGDWVGVYASDVSYPAVMSVAAYVLSIAGNTVTVGVGAYGRPVLTIAAADVFGPVYVNALPYPLQPRFWGPPPGRGYS